SRSFAATLDLQRAQPLLDTPIDLPPCPSRRATRMPRRVEPRCATTGGRRMGSGNASRYYTESAGETAAAGDAGKVPVRDFRGRQPRLQGALEQDIAPGVDDLRVGVRHPLLPGART